MNHGPTRTPPGRIAISFLFLILTIVLATATRAADGKMYTAYNIWDVGDNDQKFINFKAGKKIIPAGTEVNSVQIRKEPTGAGDIYFVAFSVANNKWSALNKNYQIFFDPRHHPGKTIEQLKELTFTTKTGEELTADFTDCELAAITSGAVVDGMRRPAVLVSYGYPPQSKTDKLSNDTWTYWLNKRNTVAIKFNDEGETVETGNVCDPAAATAIVTANTKATTARGTGNLATVQAVPPPGRSASDIMERMKVLGELKTQGIITAEEYEQKKQELMKQL